MTINKYLPFAFVYFFLNTAALPFGLTYTALLAPLFYVWILFVRKREVLLPFIVLLLPYIIVHLTIVDADTDIYAVSLLNAVLVYIFCQAVYTFLIVCKDVEKIFEAGSKAPGFILSTACSIAPAVPKENIQAMVQVARTHSPLY